MNLKMVEGGSYPEAVLSNVIQITNPISLFKFKGLCEYSEPEHGGSYPEAVLSNIIQITNPMSLFKVKGLCEYNEP